MPDANAQEQAVPEITRSFKKQPNSFVFLVVSWIVTSVSLFLDCFRTPTEPLLAVEKKRREKNSVKKTVDGWAGEV